VLQLLGGERRAEEFEEHWERVSVHGIDTTQVEKCEEEAGACLRHWPVYVALAVERLLQCGRFIELLFDRVGLALELIE